MCLTHKNIFLLILKIALARKFTWLNKSIMSSFSKYFIATRPWSFTASVVPVLVTAAICRIPLFSTILLRILIMAVSVQAGANLTNTYYDYVNGVDTKQAENGEKTLVDKIIPESHILLLSAFLYIISIASIFPFLIQVHNFSLFYVFLSGLLLAIFYTAQPVGLKYLAMGDITIFACFGPLLMQCCSICFTGKTNPLLYLYSLPIGLITENILHVNNIRDMKVDGYAGIKTLAILIGFEYSSLLYSIFFVLSYISTLYIAVFYNWGALAVFLTVPIVYDLISQCRLGKVVGLTEETAKLHSLFGLLLFLSIYLSEKGLIDVIA